MMQTFATRSLLSVHGPETHGARKQWKSCCFWDKKRASKETPTGDRGFSIYLLQQKGDATKSIPRFELLAGKDGSHRTQTNVCHFEGDGCPQGTDQAIVQTIQRCPNLFASETTRGGCK